MKLIVFLFESPLDLVQGLLGAKSMVENKDYHLSIIHRYQRRRLWLWLPELDLSDRSKPV